MGFRYRKRINLGGGKSINLSKSGPSMSQRVGPFTFNSRGRSTVRFGNGMSYSSKGCGSTALFMFTIAVAVVAAIVRLSLRRV
jgi:Protein of unknown function (DUF4236)